MKDYSRKAGVAKAGLLRYCERISKGLGRPAMKLVTNMIYGVVASDSCHLSKIGRALEEGISIKKR